MSFANFNPFFSVGNFTVADSLMLLAEKAETPWYKGTGVVLIALLVAIAIAIAIGYTFARSIRMSDYGWKMSLILASVFCATLIILAGWPPRYGVDLSGGVTFIGEVRPVSSGEDKIPIQQMITQIKKRIDPTGTKEIIVRALGDDHIEIIIPKVEDEAEADRIWDRAVSAGFLKFKIVANKGDAIAQVALDEITQRKKTVATSDGGATATWVTLGRPIDAETNEKGPFRVVPSVRNVLRNKRTSQAISVPMDFGADASAFTKWALEEGHEEMEILMLDDRFGVEGEDLSSVRMSIDNFAAPCVDFRVKADAVRKMGGLTKQYEDRRLGIVLDDSLLSAPVIQSQIRQQGQITGRFTNEEVEDLIGILKAGKLPAAINKYPISRDQVNSSIGRDLAEKGIWAIGISFGVVVLFMLFYYRFAGLVACLALFTNLALIVAMVLLIKQPITLTGLAGLVLTVGMSVDANVLIFERIREELNKGATLRMSIRNGFGRATTTIVDASITTLITAVVLYWIGTEQIRGFCVALILGILMSMYTAIFCSRVTFDVAERMKWIKSLSMSALVKTSSFDFIGKRTVALGISCSLIVVGLIAAVSLGESIFGHDLRGGTTARILFTESTEPDTVRAALRDAQLKDGNGDAIQWEVTEITSSDFPEETFFKVDSSLQPYEGDPDERPDDYPTLQSVLNEVFQGKLEKYEVKYEAPAVVDANAANDGASSTTGEPVSQLPFNQGNESPRRVLSEAGAIGAPAQDSQFVKTNSLQDPEQTTGGSGDDTQTGADTQTEDGAAETTTDQEGDATAGTDQEGSEAKQEPETTGAADPSSPSIQGDELSSFGTTIEFGFPVTAEGLREAMGEMGSDLGVRADDIVLLPVNAAADAPSSEAWEVTLLAPDAASVSTLLDRLKADYEDRTYFSSLSEVGGQIARESQLQALAAVFFSLVGIIIYLSVRFHRVVFGLAAVVALIHDVLFVIGAIAITGYVASLLGIPGFGAVKITLPVVAAFLTIIGYSLNDTIVVFDRIREVRGKNPDLTGEMINRSIGQTLSRTVLTSFTTFVVVFILLIGGGDAIQGFAFALVVGVLVGTYSSIFVASPVLLWLIQNQSKPSNKTVAKSAS